MPYTDPAQLRDHSDDWFAYYYQRRGKEVLDLIDDELIAEHERNPDQQQGPHSTRLHEVLNYFRALPVIGKTFAYAEVPYERYRLGIVTARGEEASWVSEDVYPTEQAAVHAVFLYRIKELRRAVAAREGVTG